MLDTIEAGNKGKMLKAPIFFGTAGTVATFVTSHYNEIVGGIAGTLTCVYLAIQIYYRVKHERERRPKGKHLNLSNQSSVDGGKKQT